MATVAELLQELDKEAQATRRLLERVPDDQLDWQPHAKSMTLGQLAMHIATLPGGIADISTWPSFDVSIEQPRLSAANTAELLAALDESLAQARTVLGGMDDAALATPWRLVNGDQEIMAIPRGAPPDDHAEPLVSPPGPVDRVSARAGCTAPRNLRPERGREIVRRLIILFLSANLFRSHR